MIRAEGLGFHHRGSERPALEGLSFALDPGEAVALVGPGGAGKSTLLKVLAGFAPSLVPGDLSGRVEVGGSAPGRLAPRERTERVGLVFSDPMAQLSGICQTVREEVAWGPSNLGVPREEMRERVDRALEQVGLQDVARRSPFALSGGQQQRVALASLLALAPAVLLLDEPAAMLDPEGRGELLRLAGSLAAEGRVVLWATPHLEEAAAFPRWLVLQEGRLAWDGPATIPGEPGCLEAPWTRLARRAAARGLYRGDLPVREEEALAGLRPRGGGA